MEGRRAHQRLQPTLRHLHSGGSRRLVHLLARYGGAIEVDLADRGHDLRALWQSRQWRFLLALIDGLPVYSRFAEAQADDDELAEQLARQPADAASVPSLRDWHPIRAELTHQSDQLSNLIALLAKRWGGTARFEPRPRPRTALDRAREKQRRASHEQLVKRLIPKA
jgi:hypothetical protein